MLQVQQCCTYLPDNINQINSYIANITKVMLEAKVLEEKGAWEAIKSFASVIRKGFQRLVNSLRTWEQASLVLY